MIDNLKNNQKINVAILIFNQIEAIDLNGPLDVFMKANYFSDKYNVYTVSEKREEIFSEGETLKMIAKYSFEDSPKSDILIIPGAHPEVLKNYTLKNSNILDWITKQHLQSAITMSICTGALFLAKCGILENKKATSHFLVLDDLKSNDIEVMEGVRFVHDKDVITSAAIVSGIDASLYLIKLISGEELMNNICNIMQHEFKNGYFLNETIG